MSAAKPLALITGVGPGTGTAVARRFAKGGYRVAMLARDAARLAALEKEIPDSIAITCDVSDRAALEAAITQVGAPNIVVHNAVGGAWEHSGRGFVAVPVGLPLHAGDLALLDHLVVAVHQYPSSGLRRYSLLRVLT